REGKARPSASRAGHDGEVALQKRLQLRYPRAGDHFLKLERLLADGREVVCTHFSAFPFLESAALTGRSRGPLNPAPGSNNSSIRFCWCCPHAARTGKFSNNDVLRWRQSATHTAFGIQRQNRAERLPPPVVGPTDLRTPQREQPAHH